MTTDRARGAELSPQMADALAEQMLSGIDREYPNLFRCLLRADGDLAPPRQVTPIFFGCFDWHSAVHTHWALIRLMRRFPDRSLAGDVQTALDERFTSERCRVEFDYLSAEHNSGFEMPYGIGWMLTLGAELDALVDDAGEFAESHLRWQSHLAPIVTLCAERFTDWLDRLPAPIRSGEHSQTAFAMALAFDFAAATACDRLIDSVNAAAHRFFSEDAPAPIHLEPSAHDFLSPALAEADLMRRILPADQFSIWFERFLPAVGLSPVVARDRSDGKLVHWDGLNLSRAWMLAALSSAARPQRRAQLAAASTEHLAAGLPASLTAEYAGSHWLGTYAVYATT